MLLDRSEFNSRSRFWSLLVICTFTAVILYEWNVFISEPNYHILPQNDYISIPTSNTVPEGEANAQTHHEIYSVSTNDRKYFFVDFIDRRSINPNIIPHPSLEDTWVIVAQRHDPDSRLPMTFAEITCNATFQNGTLRCLESPSILPVITTPGDKCDGDYLVLNLNIGPHDARVFYGPDAPYTIYGSNSRFTCFGQFVHDLRSLLDWGNGGTSDTGFKNATELQRPLPYGKVEKNWFVFWDHKGEIYVHYDVSPKRAFAKLELDGSVGEDLAPQAARAGDDSCMAKYLPTVGPDHESLHQATNSLSVTLCKRSDPSCKMNEENTFILTIFQHKRYRFFHSVYEPYAMLFEQKSPFKIHGISSKPFWIHGRWKPSSLNEQDRLAEMMIKDGKVRNYNQTEMMYITSMSWKSSKQKYHGFLDDVVFLGFGIEDSQSAGIDVVVGDLLTGMSLC